MNDIASYELREHVDGRWATPATTLDGWIHDPNDGARLVPMRASAPASLELALATATRVHLSGAWGERPAEERAALLRAVAEQLESRRDLIAHLDAHLTGVIHGLTRMFAAIAPRAFAAAAEQAVRRSETVLMPGQHGAVELHRLPLGPALVIAPWNAPAAIAAHKIASALAAGCPVIVKPSEYALQSCQVIVEAAEAAGLPPGVLQLVHGAGDVGDALGADPRIRAVSFTGGLAGGRAVAHRSAERIRPVQLELGGNNPLLVLPGADVEAAAEGIKEGLTLLGGQWCRALGRVLVHRSLAPALLEAVRGRLAHVRLGHSLAADSQMGPMAHARQQGHVRAALDRLLGAGGTAHAPTPLPELAGWFVAPTLVTGVPAERATEEIFGPVATWHEFDAVDEALALARLGDHGLAAYVYGPEDEALRVARRVHAGSIKINQVSVLAANPMAPRPAWGLSGLGDEGVVETFEFFRGSRVVTRGAGAA
jgi:phenylacetaldehyde dehydrogenase